MDCELTLVPCGTIRHLDFFDPNVIPIHDQPIRQFLSGDASDASVFRQPPHIRTAGGQLFDLLDRELPPSADEVRSFMAALPDAGSGIYCRHGNSSRFASAFAGRFPWSE